MRTPNLLLLIALMLLVPVSRSADAAPSDTSSPAQADAIVSAAVDRMWAQNDDYWHRGDYPRIIALDRIITQADPQFIDCYNTGAWLMWSDGRDADAAAFYRLCVANNPHDSAAYYDYGMFLYNHRHDYGTAIRVYTRDVSRANGGILDWHMLAHAYEKANHWDHAVLIWRKVKARWPHGGPGDVTMGAVDDHNLARALTHMEGAHP